MAAAVKNAVSIPVIAANLIRSPEQAEAQLQEGAQDMVSLGRPHIADPHWANKVMEGRSEDIKRCICCLYCIESMQNNAYTGGHGHCAVNPFVGKESFKLKENGNGRIVAVIGAGPAGLTAAELMAKRGFKVTVFEKSDKLGGQVDLAIKPPHKDKLSWCIEDLHTACKKAGVEIRLNTEATKELLADMMPYAVICATGAYAVKPSFIKGYDRDNVYTTTEILDGSVRLSAEKVAVIGSGMTGLETAELLTEQGNSVCIVEMADSLFPGGWMQHLDDIKPRLDKKAAEYYTSHKLLEIKDCYIVAQDKKGNIKEIPADSVVLSLGTKSDSSLYEELKKFGFNAYNIGDSLKVGRIADATAGAFDCVANID